MTLISQCWPSLGRSLKGKAQSQNSGVDIFLANPEGEYHWPRYVHWREMPAFTFGSICDAQHCGKREFRRYTTDLDCRHSCSEVGERAVPLSSGQKSYAESKFLKM